MDGKHQKQLVPEPLTFQPASLYKELIPSWSAFYIYPALHCVEYIPPCLALNVIPTHLMIGYIQCIVLTVSHHAVQGTYPSIKCFKYIALNISHHLFIALDIATWQGGYILQCIVLRVSRHVLHWIYPTTHWMIYSAMHCIRYFLSCIAFNVSPHAFH